MYCGEAVYYYVSHLVKIFFFLNSSEVGLFCDCLQKYGSNGGYKALNHNWEEIILKHLSSFIKITKEIFKVLSI